MKFDFNSLTEEEHKKMCAKAGKRSVVARRKKKELRGVIQEFLNNMVSDKSICSKILERAGYDYKKSDNLTAFGVALMLNAMSGNSKALDYAMKIIKLNEKDDLEIEKLKLENEKLRRDLGMGENMYEDLTPLADALNKKDMEVL